MYGALIRAINQIMKADSTALRMVRPRAKKGRDRETERESPCVFVAKDHLQI